MCNTFIETFYNIPKYDEVSDSSMNSKKKKMASSFVSSLGFSRNSIELQDVTTLGENIYNPFNFLDNVILQDFIY